MIWAIVINDLPKLKQEVMALLNGYEPGTGLERRQLSLPDAQHVAEAALVDDADVGVVAQGAAQFVDVAVEGVAVADLVPAPHRNHEGRCVDGPADVGGQFFQ